MAGRAHPYHPYEPDSISGHVRYVHSLQRAEASKTARKQANGLPVNRNINQTRQPEQAAVKFARKTNQMGRMPIPGSSGDRAPSVARKASSSAFPRPDETPWRMRHEVHRKLPSSLVPPIESHIPENHVARKQPTTAPERWVIQDEERIARAAVKSTLQRRSIITPSRKQTFVTHHSVKKKDREVFFLNADMDIVSTRNPTQRLATKAARKNDVVEIPSDSEEDEAKSLGSDSESTPSESSPESDVELTPTSDDELEYVDNNQEQDKETHSIPEPELLEAIRAHYFTTLRMQDTSRLPFMRRNLRRGFRNQCHLRGYGLQRPSGKPHITLVYDCPSVERTCTTHVTDWLCPVCELHGTFDNQEQLACHLTWDHPELEIRWEREFSLSSVQRVGPRWRLEVTIPAIPAPTPPPAEYPPDDASENGHPLEETREPEVQHERDLHAELRPEPSSEDEILLRPAVGHPPTPQAKPIATPVSLRSVTPAFTPQKMKMFQPIFRPTPTPSAIPRVAKRADRSCTPPPPDRMLGPAAQPPYLPDDLYSCRPGGPRVFDLLQMLDMRPFGVLAWTVIEREDEIFDSDDIKDEHKVMHALWARWILLNRSKFIANYCRGITEFVDQYWLMIHKAAGWKALRFWLMTMLANRYLKGEEVASVLKYYEAKTQMDLWYDE
ncbi:uncharacterized protein BT62DRAFT_993784 [Guyanagaster necrorhizus]|uniref:Uncharacterized protein n=1 Tax=Guyanagaster necrorhizus TaxID=856835 RepID=A0A9P8ASY9_9AGAR|nr:uncharacterized protein BT62DRAFT_993784 [Guyanagaster necrorhizus MCA 3950]KAG7446898.1 hypothetical protein BT62DRAFT_993784 [Guyanagaster necrorhizus MCA 3950]